MQAKMPVTYKLRSKLTCSTKNVDAVGVVDA